MSTLDNLETLFALTAFLFQALLIAHFALRKWRFTLAMRYGWLVYALSVPAAAVSVILVVDGKPWTLWLGGFLYLAWAIFGYLVEYIRGIQWRNPPYWPILGPYVTFYLATIMFYWWPLGAISKPLWYLYAVLFALSTLLNLTSHRASPEHTPSLQQGK
jgi:hypothetical protein